MVAIVSSRIVPRTFRLRIGLSNDANGAEGIVR